jgi:hypothetical protein
MVGGDAFCFFYSWWQRCMTGAAEIETLAERFFSDMGKRRGDKLSFPVCTCAFALGALQF